MSEEARSPYALLLLRQRSAQQRERLHQLREKYKLQDDDAVWGLLAVVESYCDDLQARATSGLPPTSPSLPSAMRWAALSLGMAVQVVFLAIAYRVGQQALQDVPGSFWSVPAGWMAFVLALPALGVVVAAGWRTRRTDPWLGWGLVTLGLIAGAASLLAVLTFR